MGKPHILAIPYPAQGHVIPLLELSLCLVKRGFRVTFVNTDYIHKRILNASADKGYLCEQINLVSIPDGMEPWEDRNDLIKLIAGIYRVMPGKLVELISSINSSQDEKITCIIADESMGWSLEVAERMNIHRAVFWSASAAAMSLLLSIHKLIDDGILDNNGTPMRNQMIQLHPAMPSINTAHFIWTLAGNLIIQKMIFDLVLRTIKLLKKEDKIICNSAYDLEPGAFDFSPEILPIGPLLASNRLGNTVGNFWPENPTCLKWLDKQPPKSVIYVAFGSITVFHKAQFTELALGLEFSGRPFLWVVRPDIVNDPNSIPEGFIERVSSQGKMVDWAPQQQVLSHPSIACFISHCGWNSTLEGVSNGVPFLCWPYFSDQFLDENYICDIWKVGLKFDRNENLIITREEIKNKIDQVVGDENFKLKALELKEMALRSAKEGGHSNNVFKNFIEWIKA